jgi:hypothetical protein
VSKPEDDLHHFLLKSAPPSTIATYHHSICRVEDSLHLHILSGCSQMAQHSLVAYSSSWTYDTTNASVTHPCQIFCILACSIESYGCVCVVRSVLCCSTACCPHLESVVGRIAVSARLYRSGCHTSEMQIASYLIQRAQFIPSLF